MKATPSAPTPPARDVARTPAAPNPHIERPSFHGIASQTAVGLSWTGVALLVAFVTRVLLARKVPAAELGIVLAAQSFMSLTLVVAELGMPDAVVRYVGRDATPGTAPKRTVFAAISVITPAALLVVVLVLAGLWTWFRGAMSPDALWAVAILTFALPLLAAGNVLGAAYRGVSRLGTKLLMVDVARPGVVAIALMLSPLAFTSHATYVAGPYAGAALLTLAALLVLFVKDRQWAISGGSTPSELLRFGVPIAGAGVVAGPLVHSALPLMLATWTGPTAVALFGIALSLQHMVYVPVAVFEQAAIPAWSRMVGQAATRDLVTSYKRFSNMCFAGATSIGLVMLANDTALLRYVFGPTYEAASWALRCAIVATLFGVLTGPNEAMLRAFGLTRAIFMARITAAGAGITAGLLLIPTYALSGAAVAFAVMNIAMNALYCVMLGAKTGVHPFTRQHSMTTGMATAGVLAATTTGSIYPVGTWVVVHVIAILVVAMNADVRLAIRKLVAS